MNGPHFEYETPRIVADVILRVRLLDGVLYELAVENIQSIDPAPDCCGGYPKAVVVNVWSGIAHVTSDDYGKVKTLVDEWRAKQPKKLF